MFRSVVNRIDSELTETKRPGEVVLTVHGLLAGCRSMRSLADAARQEGYSVMDWGYPSLRGSILHHAAGLSRMLCDLAKRDGVKQIHLVTHSMGGVIARAAILQSRLENRWADKCGRIVMLAPPNSGSRLTRLPLGPFASWFPQLKELSEAPDSFVCRLPNLRRMKVGVIAAQHDFVVDELSTHLVGQRDHATVRTSHQRLTRHPDAIEMTIEFLNTTCLRPAATTVAFETDHIDTVSDAHRRRVHSAAA
ncbi:esterase/lipase family protein [Neorhodopirellula pilleata]|uniref:Alpha/beta hydrolase family protein n=1 Tax=Neorhodopirellula pilleata TaxID=2714738 RepID=A0A5C6A1H3_9BACT|nr:alpha/beta fold hydrolase [Neorhodopirellula pilleata]TWT93101.1 Alpha/beta hydrolase family protein [Neorhodopirellula pilleata]